MKKLSFVKYAVVVFLVAGLVALTAPSAKAQNNATGGVSVVVADAIVVVVDVNAGHFGLMDWGLLAAPTPGTGNTTFQLDDLGVVSRASGSLTGKVLDSDGAVATFKIEGQSGKVVTLTLSKTDPDAVKATLSTPSSPSGTTVTLTGGVAFVKVKADLTLTPAAAGATHSGQMKLEANY